jgi:preprotein translocase subunit SecD
MAPQNTWRLILVVVVVLISGYHAYPWDKPLGGPDDGTGKPEFFYDKKIQLGLDLQGGSEIRLTPGRFQCEKCGKGSSRPGECVTCNVPYTEVIGEAEVQDAVKNAQSVLELRLNLSGMKEPRIQRIGENQILVQMPGAAPEEIERIREILKKTGRLEFKLEADETMKTAAKTPSTENPQGYAPAGTQWIVVQGRAALATMRSARTCSSRRRP